MFLNPKMFGTVEVMKLQPRFRMRGKRGLFKLHRCGANLIKNKSKNSLQRQFSASLGEDTWWIF